jgi:hypothetical protein
VVCQSKRYNSVVSLPECADEEEGEAYEDCSFVIEFHNDPFFLWISQDILTQNMRFVKYLHHFLTFV